MSNNERRSPEAFFQYCSIGTEDRRKWLREILVENTVYFRTRIQLNDPKELRPRIVFDGSEKEVRSFVRNLINTHHPGRHSPAARLRLENQYINRIKRNPDTAEEPLHEVLDEVGVLSVSETPTQELLWAHYADGHRGVVLEFDSNSGLFLAAQPVIYSDERPVINRVKDSPNELANKAMFTKGTAWSYEREWRVIARWRDEDRVREQLSKHSIPKEARDFLETQNGPGHYSIPVNAIRRVVLGARIDAENERWIRTLLSGKSNSPELGRAGFTEAGEIRIYAV